jgi:hypothetical protein
MMNFENNGKFSLQGFEQMYRKFINFKVSTVSIEYLFFHVI